MLHNDSCLSGEKTAYRPDSSKTHQLITSWPPMELNLMAFQVFSSFLKSNGIVKARVTPQIARRCEFACHVHSRSVGSIVVYLNDTVLQKDRTFAC